MVEQMAGSPVLKSARSKRIGIWILGLLMFFSLLGYFAAPPLIKSILLKQLALELHREVSIAKVEINPYALSARISGLSVRSGEGKEVLGFDELFVNVSAASIFKLAAVVDELRLQGLRVAVARLADERYDISDLLDKWMQPSDQPPGEMPHFSLNNIQLIGGKLEFDDQPKGKVHTISEINLALPFISNLPHQVEILVEPSFSANINGSPLVLTGESKPFAGSHESELALNLERLDLADFQPYLPASLPFRVVGGKLDSELKIIFKELPEQIFSLAMMGNAQLSGLTLTGRNGQPLLGWKQLDVDLGDVDLINQNFAIKRVALDGLDVSLAVNRQGEFNVLQLAEQLNKPDPGNAGKAKSSDSSPVAWSLGEFALNNGLIRWQDDSGLAPVVGQVRDLNVLVGKLDSKLADPIEISEASYQIDLGERFRVAKMAVKGMRIDLPAHRIDIAEVSNSQLRGRMLRNKAGKIEWVSSPLLKTIRATDTKVQDERPWIGKVSKLTIEDLGFRFEDQSMLPVAMQEIDGFNLRAENLTNEPGSKGTISLKSRINKKGSLSVDGSLQVFPLDVAVKLETSNLPLLSWEPYLAEHMNVALTRGQFSNKGEVSVLIDKEGLKAAYKGSATLGNLLAVDKENSADFLKWKSLFLEGIDFRLAPMAINIGEIALTDFYSKLILSQAGRLNVQDIIRKPAVTEAEKSAAVPVEEKPAIKAPIPINIARITLQNGTVNFSDFFIKPNYTVNLTRLGGRVSGLSSAADSVADLDLRGSYANTAPVQIGGKLNPLASKSFLDLKVDVSGVDLIGFSPYSGKYAGYDIEKGKLSLNLGYKLENNRLSAENRLFIDQLTFGNKVDSPDATSLPVNLAISLLKNNRGEIDLNLPISGSLDDPQFSIGGVIVKVIVNLFTKAVTSPFALLGSMLGSGEELSNVEFLPGRSMISDGAAKKLALLAKALSERAALKLEISGLADPETDREGVRRLAVERAVKAEKLKDVLKKGGEGESLDSVELTPAEYKNYLTRAYSATKFPKPRNAVGFQKTLPAEEMEKLMLANVSAGDDEIHQLAKQRAENVQVWLIEQGKIAPQRLFLVPPKAGSNPSAKASRVDFSLR